MATRGRYARGEARRAEILDATVRLIGQDGYRNMSVRGIARDLGIDPANLLYYFGSREKLLEEVIAKWDRDYVELAAAAGYSEFDLDWWVRTSPKNAEVPGLLHMLVVFSAEAAEPEHPSHEFMNARIARLRSAIADALARRQRSGELLASADVDELARSMVALVSGLQMLWLGDRSVPLSELIRDGVQSLMDGAKDRTHA